MPGCLKPALVTSFCDVHPENLSDNQIKTLFLGYAYKNSHFCVADFTAFHKGFRNFHLFNIRSK